MVAATRCAEWAPAGPVKTELTPSAGDLAGWREENDFNLRRLLGEVFTARPVSAMGPMAHPGVSDLVFNPILDAAIPAFRVAVANEWSRAPPHGMRFSPRRAEPVPWVIDAEEPDCQIMSVAPESDESAQRVAFALAQARRCPHADVI